MASKARSTPSIKDLYTPEALQITVGPNKRTFNVPRGLICAKSDYFNKAFKRHFLEGKQGAITLVDVKEWIFECFVGWLYTERIFWEPLDESVDAEGPTPQTKLDGVEDQDFDEGVRQDPVTWSCSYLIELFVFADQHDTRLLRNAVIECFQIKMLQSTPKVYSMFSMGEACAIFENLPSSSTLYRFTLDMLVYSSEPGALDPPSIAEYTQLPVSALAMIAIKALQLREKKDCYRCEEGEPCDRNKHPNVAECYPDFKFDICTCHEHETDDERELCRRAWKGLSREHGINLFW